MAGLSPEIVQVLDFFSGIFALNPELLVFPTFIGSVIIPMIVNSYAIKLITDRIKLPFIFGWTVGLVTAYLTLPWGFLMVYGSVLIIAFLGQWRVSVKAIFLVAMILFLTFGLPYVYGLLTEGLRF